MKNINIVGSLGQKNLENEKDLSFSKKLSQNMRYFRFMAVFVAFMAVHNVANAQIFKKLFNNPAKLEKKMAEWGYATDNYAVIPTDISFLATLAKNVTEDGEICDEYGNCLEFDEKGRPYSIQFGDDTDANQIGRALEGELLYVNRTIKEALYDAENPSYYAGRHPVLFEKDGVIDVYEPEESGISNGDEIAEIIEGLMTKETALNSIKN